ncbi:MAG: nucleotide exchange factor GrpE [Arthrospira sp. PLM2.Bin9]|nr:nucleotide exchange factor GrpE [Arthrospira sp. PLM2.Bin9]TVU55501.1 MAG: nucleotide exchange factor GrpE [Arthrospira sp. PLM2.Bin9]
MDDNKQEDMVPNSTSDKTDETPEPVGQAASDAGYVDPEQIEQQMDTESDLTLEQATIADDGEEAADAELSSDPIYIANEQLNEQLQTIAQARESLQTQLMDMTSQYQRLAADFENFRKRTQKEKEDLELNIKCSTIGQLLPVIDNFERARAHIKPQNDGEMNIHKSYQGVYKQMVECLKQIGVSPMRPEGEPFDPNLHEAVMREPTSEYPEGTVIEELMRGYILGDRVLRHAMVKVATEPEVSDTTEEPPAEGSVD